MSILKISEFSTEKLTFASSSFIVVASQFHAPHFLRVCVCVSGTEIKLNLNDQFQFYFDFYEKHPLRS